MRSIRRTLTGSEYPQKEPPLNGHGPTSVGDEMARALRGTVRVRFSLKHWLGFA